MVRDVEYLSRNTALEGTCPECGSIDYYPALVHDQTGELRMGAHCDDRLHSEVLE